MVQKIDNKILFIVNGRNNAVKKLQKQLKKSNFLDYNLVVTAQEKEAITVARDNASNFDLIVGIGGDGTIHEMVNGLLQSGLKQEELPKLCIIPAGTANDFARTLSFPENFNELEHIISNPFYTSVDVGEMRHKSAEGKDELRYFINIADAGIGAAVVEQVNKLPRKWGGNITFFKAIIKAFRLYKNIPVKCVTEDWQWEGFIKMFVIANGKSFGSGLIIAPQAKVDDGKFEIVIGADISTFDYLKNLPILKRGYKIIHPQLYYREAKKLTLTSSQNCPIEADGELIGYTPLEIINHQKMIQFLVKT